VARYFATRRARVQPFVDRHFSLLGSAAIHRAALRWDILRAPANILLAGPHAGVKAAGSLARAVGARRLGEMSVAAAHPTGNGAIRPSIRRADAVPASTSAVPWPRHRPET
jgi:hypothetical protein